MFSNYLLCFCLCYIFIETEQCLKSKIIFENHLGTKTPYRIVSNKSFEKIHYKGCEPQKIWMIIRHGTRYPNRNVINQMRNRLPEIQRKIIENEHLLTNHAKEIDLDLFKKWTITLENEDDNKLTHEGEEEMILLAERMQTRFPELFHSAYSNTSFKFKYTQSQRTEKSASYFAAGLFGKETARSVWFPHALQRDPILRFYKLCDKWKADIKENLTAMQEKIKFDNGEEMLKTVKDINNRLKLTTSLNSADVILIYRTCGFETAWHKTKKSPWCSIFTEENFKVLEYSEDLKYFWQDGYGYELTYKQACPLFNDMITFLLSRSTYPKVSVYFTHSGTLLKLLAHLGLYKDENYLTANNFLLMSNRKYRTSKIDSFGTNVALILYKCGDKEKILTLHQENIVRLPICPLDDLCSLEDINDYYIKSINSCDFESLCNNN